MKFSHIACGILAGGEGKRMGQDKSLLPIRGKPAIEHLLERLRPLFDHILVSTNHEAPFHAYQLTTIKDDLPIRCPLVGIYSLLLHSPCPYMFITACDMPFPDIELIRLMVSQLEMNDDIVVPESSKGVEPLFAIYSRHCVSAIKKNIEANQLKVSDFYPQVKARVLKVNTDFSLSSEDDLFFNINTPNDYRKVQ